MLQSHWVANQSKRCNVVMEGDPPPGALVGRLSFKSFNPSIHRLQEEAEEHLVKLKKDVDAEGGEYSVSDNEMAQTIAKRWRLPFGTNVAVELFVHAVLSIPSPAEDCDFVAASQDCAVFLADAS